MLSVLFLCYTVGGREKPGFCLDIKELPFFICAHQETQYFYFFLLEFQASSIHLPCRLNNVAAVMLLIYLWCIYVLESLNC